MHHSTETTAAWRSGQLVGANASLVLPNSERIAVVTVLTGFQSATTRNGVGILAVGTKALETNDTGINQMKPALCATWTLLTLSPMNEEIQIIV